MPNQTPPVELLVLPYDSANSRSLAHVLIEELRSSSWSRFQCAVAFISDSGNFTELLHALLAFAHTGRSIEMTFGADSFSPESRGSDYRAVERILQTLADEPSVEVHLYHEQRRTFHPKMYLFSNEADGKALLIVGSSNWSTGGFVQNIEANLLVRLDFGQPSHQHCFAKAQQCFADYWREV